MRTVQVRIFIRRKSRTVCAIQDHFAVPRCEHCGLELGQIHQGNSNDNTLPQYANHITHVPPDEDVCSIDDDTANMVFAAYASVTENK